MSFQAQEFPGFVTAAESREPIDAGMMRFCFRAQSLDVIGREASGARLITNKPER